jgi:hypothetical protein
LDPLTDASYWVVTTQTLPSKTSSRWIIAIIAVAAAVTVGVGAFLLASREAGIDHEVRGRLIGADSLGGIVAPNQANLPAPVVVHRELRGPEAVRASEIGLEAAPGLTDAALVEFDFAAAGGEHKALFRSFVSAYETVADAEIAFETAVTHLESPRGWNLSTGARPGDEPDMRLGDESEHYVQGEDLGYPELSVFLWRLDNAVLLTADFHPYDWPGLIGVISRDLDSRARGQ